MSEGIDLHADPSQSGHFASRLIQHVGRNWRPLRSPQCVKPLWRREPSHLKAANAEPDQRCFQAVDDPRAFADQAFALATGAPGVLLLKRGHRRHFAVTRLRAENEKLVGALSKLKVEHQAVKDELARLKHLPPRPPRKPSGMDKAADAKGPEAGDDKGGRSTRRRASQLDTLTIGATVVVRPTAHHRADGADREAMSERLAPIDDKDRRTPTVPRTTFAARSPSARSAAEPAATPAATAATPFSGTQDMRQERLRIPGLSGRSPRRPGTPGHS